MFTRQTLRHLANDNSFTRGQNYYDEGNVTKLRREGDTFQARVQGSRSYRVSLRLAAADPDFACDCPYEFGGICKHAVALGLAVLDAYGPNLTSAGPAATGADAPLAPSALATAVADAWAGRAVTDKLLFLEQALGKSDDLARQFLGFVGRPAPSPDPLATLSERLTDTLSMLEFDEEFWESSEAYHDEDEGDGLYEAGAEVLREALASFVAELLRLARGGQLTTALRYWTTACTAIYQVEEPGSDEYGLFGDYGTDVLRQWHDDLRAAGWPAVLLAAVIPPAELEAALTWLGAYLSDPPARWPDFEPSWQPLLLALAADPIAAPLLPAHLPQAAFSPAAWARLGLQRARTLTDDGAWREAAETLLPHDAAVAQQLLHYYATHADGPALLRTATTAFAAWPDRFSDYVLTTFSAAQAPDLYRDALRYRALANQSRDDFERLRPLLAPDDLAAFVQAAVTAARDGRSGVAFAADLLAREATPAALRDFVLGLEWLHISPANHSEIALMRLAEIDPTPLMLALEERLPAYLVGRAGAKRGAFLYDRLGRWLAAVRGAAPRLAEPVLRLALALREEFPTLYGLRDALRREGLLPTEPPFKKISAGRRG